MAESSCIQCECIYYSRIVALLTHYVSCRASEGKERFVIRGQTQAQDRRVEAPTDSDTATGRGLFMPSSLTWSSYPSQP